MCCTWLAGNAGPKKWPKNRHLGTIAQLCRAISSQLRHVLTIGKKLVAKRSSISATGELLLDKVTDYVDKGINVDVIFLDLAKAFDKVIHVLTIW